MNGRTTSIVAVLTLALGGGVGFLKFVSPAMAERAKLTEQKNDLGRQADALNQDIYVLQHQLNGLALGSIAYFDLTNELNKRRVLEAKTVETLASLTEILNDNHLRVVSLDPQGETQGLNRPVPATPAPTALPAGQTPGPLAASAAPTASPTPIPGATTPPPPVALTHKAFTLKLEGEYPDYVKALTEFEALPRAISINAFKVKLVHDNSLKGQSAMQNAGLEKGGTQPSQSLLALDMDLSITFVMDSGGASAPGEVAPAAQPSKHASGLLARSGQGPSVGLAPAHFRLDPLVSWLCPAAEAAEPPHRRGQAPLAGAPRAYTSLKAVSWVDGALRLRTATGASPRFRVVGHRTGFLMLELDRTLSTGVTLFPVTAPGVLQVLALPAPGRPGATHLAITGVPGSRLRPVLGPDRVLRIRVDSPEAIARAHFGAPPAASAVALVKRQPKQQKFKSVALLPPHRAARMAGLAAGARTAAPLAQATGLADNPQALQVVVTPHGSFEPPTPLVSPSPLPAPDTSWQHRLVAAAAAAAGPLHGVPAAGAVGQQELAPAAAAPQPLDPPVAIAVPVKAQAPEPGGAAPQASLGRAPASKRHPLVLPRPAAAPGLPTRVAYAADELTHLDGAQVVGDELRITTHGAPADFQVLGGGRALLLLSADHLPLPGRGKLLKVGVGGIKQVRAGLFDARSLTSHVAIDTDGSVRLVLLGEEHDVLRLRIIPLPGAARAHLQSATTADVTTSAVTTTLDVPMPTPRASRRPVVQASSHAVAARAVPRPTLRLPAVARLAAPRPQPAVGLYSHPTATPTPMAVPMRPLQLVEVPRSGSPLHPRPTAAPAWLGGHPVPMATPRASSPFDGHSLNARPEASSYHFPIARGHVTGRRNPFAPLPNPLVTPTPSPLKPGGAAVQALPLPLPASGGLPGSRGLSAVSHQYHLKAVMIGGGYPPSALVLVDGKTVLVGLKQGLPGNARVKSIKSDAVILSAHGQELHLRLER